MRNLSFRAWHPDQQRMFKVSSISLAMDGDVFVFDPETAERYSNCEIMQATGLKDQDGVEIFEGDVLLREWDGESQSSKPPEGDVHVYDYYIVEWTNQGFGMRNRKIEIQNYNGKPWRTFEYHTCFA